MKNKKGFTLVELLAVIAILALLVIIAMPNILKRFNQAKKDTFITEVKKVYSEVTDAYVNNTLSGNHKTLYSSETNDLDMTGDIKYCVVTDSQGNIEYMEVADGSYYSTYDKTKQIEKYNSSDVNEVNEDYVMDCSSKVTTIKKCYTTSMAHSEYIKEDGTKVDMYSSGSYNYIYNMKGKEDEWTDELSSKFILDEDKKLYYIIDYSEGWGVKAKDDVTEITDSPCSSINNEPVVYASAMFYGLSLNKIDFSDFDTSNIEDMSYMFANAGIESDNGIENFETISNLDTTKVKNMFLMLWNAVPSGTNLELDLSGWKTSNVQFMMDLFTNFSGLTAAKTHITGSLKIKGLDNWDTSNVEYLSRIFCNVAPYAKSVELNGVGSWELPNVKDKDLMFAYTATNLSYN